MTTSPLIVGAGPAGCAAALRLSARDVAAMVIERDRETGDALCGGFMSWRTLDALATIGIVPRGHDVRRVALFASGRHAEAPLPRAAVGLSRRALDRQMQAAVIAHGIGIERGVMVRAVEHRAVRLDDATRLDAPCLFLGVGKHDVRGAGRSRGAGDPTLGLRIRMAPHPALTRLIGDAIELHLFDGGYSGLVLQEDGSANLCLAVRKSKLTEAGGRPETLLRALGDNGPLGERLAFADNATIDAIDAIAAVPYGWRATTTTDGVFRLGDQAAVIPSLAGEGIGIAVASGIAAAEAFATGGSGAAHHYQHDFARRSRRPVTTAHALWRAAERPIVARAMIPLVGRFPALAGLAARATRIRD